MGAFVAPRDIRGKIIFLQGGFSLCPRVFLTLLHGVIKVQFFSFTVNIFLDDIKRTSRCVTANMNIPRKTSLHHAVNTRTDNLSCRIPKASQPMAVLPEQSIHTVLSEIK